MATVTLGSPANNTWTALPFSLSATDADIATITAAIKGDKGPSSAPIGAGYLMPGAWSRIGTLYFPGRQGFINLLPGDYIAICPSSGWPVVLSATAAATAADVTHT